MDGWEGSISTRDVLRAALNPHELIGQAGRSFTIPAATEAVYLYPRNRVPAGDLAAYVEFAEKAGVHRKQLVQSNGSPSGWYRQVRGIVRSRWALPYNSGYAYGAWNNAGGAVLNGRFVGVDPKDGIDPVLLGAVLNSTYVMATRLLEGTATGVEGAFDVGPPAVRRMMVPDVRRMSEKHAALIRSIVKEMQDRDFMPPAPSRDAAVDLLRHKLDLAILEALGETKGAASAVVGRLYERYGRWRHAVEDVEVMMRVNRRAMQRHGQGRGVKPADMAARRVWEELSPTVRLFPSGLLGDEELQRVQVPRNFKISDQEPMFQPGIISVPGGKEVDLGSYDRVRYASMLITMGFLPPLLIPTDPSRAGVIADAFQSQLLAFRAQARARASNYIAGPSIHGVVEAAERLWLKACREHGMSAVAAEQAGGQT